MKTKLILLCCLFVSTLNATYILTGKNIYQPEEKISIRYDGMSGGPKDWFAIYPAGSSNDWANVISWNYVTDGVTTGGDIFLGLDIGDYEVRAFFKNSYNLEAKYAFSVKATNSLSLFVKQKVYSKNEEVQVRFTKMLGHQQDWIAIYPQGSSNDWANVVAWKWVKGLKFSNNFTIASVPPGNYEVRGFFKNSYKLEAKDTFTVINANATKVSTSKSKYFDNQDILINYQEMSGDQQDWVAIYPLGTSNDWANVVAWKWTNGQKNASNVNMGQIPSGDYEVRAFFKNSYTLETKSSFVVLSNSNNELILEAKDACLNNNNESNSLICSKETNIVYSLKLFHYGINNNPYKIFRINITPDQETVQIVEVFRPQNNGSASFKKLDNTSLFCISSQEGEGNLFTKDSFYHKGNLQFSILYQGLAETNKLRGTTETIENGNKLRITYQQYDHNTNQWINYVDIYNIQDTANVTLISHTEV